MVRAGPDYWQLARQASAVVVGEASTDGENVTLAVRQVLKGRDVPETMEVPPTRFPVLSAGRTWVVFLKAGHAGQYAVLDATSTDVPSVQQAARDVVELDSLPDDRAKCRLLVRLARQERGFSTPYAMWELRRKYNKPEFLDLLVEFANSGVHERDYVEQLLRENPGPKATEVLLAYLKSDKMLLVHAAIRVLADRETGNEAISKALVGLLDHRDPSIRARAVSAVCRRRCNRAFPRVFRCLDDPDPSVRAAVLTWWREWSRPDLRPLVLPKARALARDWDDYVRSLACARLVDMRDVRSFYFLWATSLMDRTGTVRSAIHLDLLWEDSPVTVSLLLVWPTLLLLAVVLFVRWRYRARWLLRSVAIGLVGAYVAGAAGGYLIGEYHTTNPVFSAFILTPPLALPIGILVAVLFRAMAARTIGSRP